MWRCYSWLHLCVAHYYGDHIEPPLVSQTVVIPFPGRTTRRSEPWETEISYGGEADLHTHLVDCDKNPGHLKFVPVDLFGVDHLPPGCQENLLAEMVRAQSDITLRVSVKYVSERRPETFPGSGKPYPYYMNRGRVMMRLGTGWVWRVGIFPKKDNVSNPTCGCKECLSSPTPITQFAVIHVRTAAHVVFDDIEGAATTCHLSSDRSGTPYVCEGGIALTGMSWVWKDIDDDWCVMGYVTHDLDLAHKLHKMVVLRYIVLDKVRARYDPRNNKHEPGFDPVALQKLTIIVSYPHGCSKQVSVGYCKDRGGWGDGDSQVTYTTATCPGSSGAPVYVLGEGMGYLYPLHVHSGICEGSKELNFASWRSFPNYLT